MLFHKQIRNVQLLNGDLLSSPPPCWAHAYLAGRMSRGMISYGSYGTYGGVCKSGGHFIEPWDWDWAQSCIDQAVKKSKFANYEVYSFWAPHGLFSDHEVTE